MKGLLVLRRDRELLAHLARVNTKLPDFVLAYLAGEVTPEEELAVAEHLAVLAEDLRQHALARHHGLDSQAEVFTSRSVLVAPGQGND